MTGSRASRAGSWRSYTLVAWVTLLAVNCLLGSAALSLYALGREDYSKSCNNFPHNLLPCLIWSSTLLGVGVVAVIPTRRIAILLVALAPGALLLADWYRFAHDMVNCGN